MGRQAKHHFIPKCYLKGFTIGGTDSSQFWGVPNNDSKPFLTRPNDACSQRDYYTVDAEDSLAVEKWYANKIEPKIKFALKHIEDYSRLPDGEQRENFIILLATLYLRNPEFRALLEVPLQHAKRVAKSISKEVLVANLSDLDFSKTDTVEIELRLLDRLCTILCSMHYRLFINNDPKFDLITSDQPFMLTHPNAERLEYYGLTTPDIQLWVPLNRKAFALGLNQPAREKIKVANKEEVALINTMLSKRAKRFLYTSKPEILMLDNNGSIFTYNVGG